MQVQGTRASDQCKCKNGDQDLVTSARIRIRTSGKYQELAKLSHSRVPLQAGAGGLFLSYVLPVPNQPEKTVGLYAKPYMTSPGDFEFMGVLFTESMLTSVIGSMDAVPP